MDTKFIAMVGALIVLGGAVYFIATGDVLPGGDEGSVDINGDENGTTGGDTEETARNGTAQNGTAQNGTELTENETEEEVIPAGVECHRQEGEVNVENVYSDAGPPFDERKAESMLHDAFNELRDAQTGLDTEPLLCDPGIREVAQEHSAYMAEQGFLGSNRPDGKGVAERYLEECLDDDTEIGNITDEAITQKDTDNGIKQTINLNKTVEGEVSENRTVEIHEFTGRWLYQRNRDLDWNGVGLSQRDEVELIQDHDDLVRDIRGLWVNAGLDEVISDIFMEREGVGMHINRETRLVHVTHAICGDYNLNQ